MKHEKQEARIDAVFARWELMPDKKKMFGGLAYMVSNKMACAILSTGEIIVRVPAELRDDVFHREYSAEAYMAGHPMKNWAVIHDSANNEEFEALLEIGRDFALSL